MTTALHANTEQAQPRGDTGLDVVTGAFSYSGRAIASALLQSGRRVRTMTGHPGRAPDHSPLEVRPLDFDNPLGLVESLEGATTLYNTYWVRFAHQRVDHDLAVANSPGRRAADRPHQHHPPERRIPLAVFQGQGSGRARIGRD